MAHFGYKENNRRELTLYDRKIKEVLPDHFIQDYPQFITFLEKYYEWIESEESPAELVHHLFETKDIVETDLSLLGFLEDELLLGESYFQGFVDKRGAAQIASNLYKSKGSKLAIQQFFRSFFGEDPDIEYTSEKVFNLNSSEIGPLSNRFITDDKLYQTFAILIKIGIPITVWREVYKLFVHPAGFYLAGQIQAVGEAAFGGTPFDGYDLMDSAGRISTPVVSLIDSASFTKLTADQSETSHYAIYDSTYTGGLGKVKVHLDRYHIDQFEDFSLDPLARFTPTTLKTLGGFVVPGERDAYAGVDGNNALIGTIGVDYDSSYVTPKIASFDMDSSTNVDQIGNSNIDFSIDSDVSLTTFMGTFGTFDRK
jgi:hypothetical protein